MRTSFLSHEKSVCQLQVWKRAPCQRPLLHLLQKTKMATKASNLQALQTKSANPRQRPLRRMLQLHIPPRQKQSLQPAKTKQRWPQDLQKNNQILRHLRLRQNRRHPPHRLKQAKQHLKKPNRPLPKPPPHDPQLQLPKRTLPNPQRKRLRPPLGRKTSLSWRTIDPKSSHFLAKLQPF